MATMQSMTKNKTLAIWLALVGGPMGLHRLYLIGWRDSGQPYAKYVRLTPRKPLAAFAWIAGATVPGAWLAGQATRWLSPRTIGDPSRIRVDLASEPPK